MAALVFGLRQVLAHGLPGDRPVFAGLVVAQIDVVAGAVQRNAVGAEARDALVLGVLVEGIAAGVVRDDGAQVLRRRDSWSRRPARRGVR